MADRKKLTDTSAWTLLATSSYNAAAPAATTGAFPDTLATFYARKLTDTGTSSAEGCLFTLNAGSPTLFAGVVTTFRGTHSAGSGAQFELWTKVAGAWTQQLALTMSDPDQGGVSGKFHVYDLFLATPLAGVTDVWITYDPGSGGTTTVFVTAHLYEWAAESLPAGGDPFADLDSASFATTQRVRAATPAGTDGLMYCLADAVDLTIAETDDAPATSTGAWSVWDLPCLLVAQSADKDGNDVIVVAYNGTLADGSGTVNTLWLLDWSRYRDELSYENYSPIYRRLEMAPVPSLPDMDNTETTHRYALQQLKRFRAFLFEMADAPTDAVTRFRITVSEFGVSATARTTTRTTLKRNAVPIAVRGMQFSVLLEHAANEVFTPLYWWARWDMVGPRVRDSQLVA